MFRLNRWKINRYIKKIKALQASRLHNQPSDQMLKREISYCIHLANIYKKVKGNIHYPFAEVMEIACYKAAALLNDSASHYQLSQALLNEAIFRQNLNTEGVFESEANAKRCFNLFEEAMAHLLAAESLGHIPAKRLRGLCLINGWGIAADKDQGFELIVASIEQEGSWDKIPQIFASLGLNKPEFFSAIMQRRKQT